MPSRPSWLPRLGEGTRRALAGNTRPGAVALLLFLEPKEASQIPEHQGVTPSSPTPPKGIIHPRAMQIHTEPHMSESKGFSSDLNCDFGVISSLQSCLRVSALGSGTSSSSSLRTGLKTIPETFSGCLYLLQPPVKCFPFSRAMQDQPLFWEHHGPARWCHSQYLSCIWLLAARHNTPAAAQCPGCRRASPVSFSCIFSRRLLLMK